MICFSGQVDACILFSLYLGGNTKAIQSLLETVDSMCKGPLERIGPGGTVESMLKSKLEVSASLKRRVEIPEARYEHEARRCIYMWYIYMYMQTVPGEEIVEYKIIIKTIPKGS